MGPSGGGRPSWSQGNRPKVRRGGVRWPANYRQKQEKGYMAERDESGRFAGGTSGNPADRPCGAVNKVTSEVKKALYEAFERAGGQEYLVKIAQEQPAVFCRMLVKLIPSEVKIDPEGPQVTLHLRDYTGLSAKDIADGAQPREIGGRS